MSKREEYEVPGSIKEMFEEEGYYKIINYNFEMDNVEAMRHFLEIVEIPVDNILLDVGTQIHLWHPEFDFHLVIDSSGLGDFFSHQYEITKITSQEYIDEIKAMENVPDEINELIKKDSVNAEDMKQMFYFLNNLL